MSSSSDSKDDEAFLGNLSSAQWYLQRFQSSLVESKIEGKEAIAENLHEAEQSLSEVIDNLRDSSGA